MRILIVLLALLIACSPKEDFALENDIIISEKEQEVMLNCFESRISNQDDIKKLILGKWTLAGYACGFCAPHTTPSAKLEFKGSTGILEFEDDFEGKIEIKFSWKLELIEDFNGNKGYKLITNPFHYALPVNQFCESYMYFNHTPVDGHMFIYRKDK